MRVGGEGEEEMGDQEREREKKTKDFERYLLLPTVIQIQSIHRGSNSNKVTSSWNWKRTWQSLVPNTDFQMGKGVPEGRRDLPKCTV